MESPSSGIVYLIRHGETEWNRAGRWQGHLDVPLSAAGRAQAARLARRLADDGTRFDALYASDLSRAWETAELLGGALGMAPSAAPALREIDLGEWAGKTREEIARAFPDEWRKLNTKQDFPRGGGETFAGFQKRVMDWMNHTAKKHLGTIGVVTHGGCIRAILLHALGLTWAEREKIPAIENGSVTVVERGAGGWKIVRMNDTRGMGKVGPDEGGTEKNEGDPA